jgi:hypothetical protein
MLEDAEQSNDSARMRGAIGQARKAIAEMKYHMDRRMNVMDMMKRTHGRVRRNSEPRPGAAAEKGWPESRPPLVLN